MVALASISLLVGGIGIMNIMLASILERTREIGVRRALGARRSDIVRQFLIETVLISFVGGTIGVIAGVGISRLIGFFAGWSTIVTASSILLAFVVSVSVGLVFGLYPARRAARLGPIEHRVRITSRPGRAIRRDAALSFRCSPVPIDRQISTADWNRPPGAHRRR